MSLTLCWEAFVLAATGFQLIQPYGVLQGQAEEGWSGGWGGDGDLSALWPIGEQSTVPILM